MSSMMCMCMICLDTLDGGSEKQPWNCFNSLTQCGHILHIYCLLHWWDTAQSFVNANLNHHGSAEEVRFVTGNPVLFTCPVCGACLGNTALFFPLSLSFPGSESGFQKVKEPTKKVEDREAKSIELSAGADPSTSADK